MRKYFVHYLGEVLNCEANLVCRIYKIILNNRMLLVLIIQQQFGIILTKKENLIQIGYEIQEEILNN